MILAAGAGFISIGKSGWGDFPDDSAPLMTSAGIAAFGLGRIITTFDDENYGIVSVEETPLPRVRDHLCVGINHTVLVASQEVAERAAAFLRNGRFLRQTPVQ